MMGKRSNFERVPRDFYPTPQAAVSPLLPHLGPLVSFDEPCAGNGALVEILENTGRLCSSMSDIEPQIKQIERKDLFSVRKCSGDMFITNPPWDRKILHPLIMHLSAIAPTWLLFDSSWSFTKQSAPFMPWCHKIVAVGRVKWFPETKMTGKDDCAWYLFDGDHQSSTVFFGR